MLTCYPTVMPTRWKLKEVLDGHGITPYQLSLKVEAKLSRNAIYSLVREQPNRLQLSTLDTLIPALCELTGSRIRINDLLEYEGAEEGPQPSPTDDAELRRMIDTAGTLVMSPGKGKPKGSSVRIAQGASVGAAVVEQRNKSERHG